MHTFQKLNRAFRDFLALVEEEAARNPVFANRLESIAAALPAIKKTPRKRVITPSVPTPDVFAAYELKGEEEFRYWLRSLDLPTLKAIVKTNGFDTGKISRRWSDADKFSNLIVEQTRSRLRRGSGFLPPKES